MSSQVLESASSFASSNPNPAQHYGRVEQWPAVQRQFYGEEAPGEKFEVEPNVSADLQKTLNEGCVNTAEDVVQAVQKSLFVENIGYAFLKDVVDLSAPTDAYELRQKVEDVRRQTSANDSINEMREILASTIYQGSEENSPFTFQIQQIASSLADGDIEYLGLENVDQQRIGRIVHNALLIISLESPQNAQRIIDTFASRQTPTQAPITNRQLLKAIDRSFWEISVMEGNQIGTFNYNRCPNDKLDQTINQTDRLAQPMPLPTVPFGQNRTVLQPSQNNRNRTELGRIISQTCGDKAIARKLQEEAVTSLPAVVNKLVVLDELSQKPVLGPNNLTAELATRGTDLQARLGTEVHKELVRSLTIGSFRPSYITAIDLLSQLRDTTRITNNQTFAGIDSSEFSGSDGIIGKLLDGSLKPDTVNLTQASKDIFIALAKLGTVETNDQTTKDEITSAREALEKAYKAILFGQFMMGPGRAYFDSIYGKGLTPQDISADMINKAQSELGGDRSNPIVSALENYAVSLANLKLLGIIWFGDTPEKTGISHIDNITPETLEKLQKFLEENPGQNAVDQISLFFEHESGELTLQRQSVANALRIDPRDKREKNKENIQLIDDLINLGNIEEPEGKGLRATFRAIAKAIKPRIFQAVKTIVAAAAVTMFGAPAAIPVYGGFLALGIISGVIHANNLRKKQGLGVRQFISMNLKALPGAIKESFANMAKAVKEHPWLAITSLAGGWLFKTLTFGVPMLGIFPEVAVSYMREVKLRKGQEALRDKCKVLRDAYMQEAEIKTDKINMKFNMKTLEETVLRFKAQTETSEQFWSGSTLFINTIVEAFKDPAKLQALKDNTDYIEALKAFEEGTDIVDTNGDVVDEKLKNKIERTVVAWNHTIGLRKSIEKSQESIINTSESYTAILAGLLLSSLAFGITEATGVGQGVREGIGIGGQADIAPRQDAKPKETSPTVEKEPGDDYLKGSKLSAQEETQVEGLKTMSPGTSPTVDFLNERTTGEGNPWIVDGKLVVEGLSTEGWNSGVPVTGPAYDDAYQLRNGIAGATHSAFNGGTYDMGAWIVTNVLHEAGIEPGDIDPQIVGTLLNQAQQASLSGNNAATIADMVREQIAQLP